MSKFNHQIYALDKSPRVFLTIGRRNDLFETPALVDAIKYTVLLMLTTNLVLLIEFNQTQIRLYIDMFLFFKSISHFQLGRHSFLYNLELLELEVCQRAARVPFLIDC